MQRVIVGGFIFKDGKVLLVKRGPGFLADHWENPGGKLEFKEDPVCGILREVKEEVGLDVEVVEPYHVWHDVTNYKGVETHFVEIDFILKMKSEKIVLESKLADFGWFSKAEVESLLMSKEMRDSILRGFERVSKGK